MKPKTEAEIKELFQKAVKEEGVTELNKEELDFLYKRLPIDLLDTFMRLREQIKKKHDEIRDIQSKSTKPEVIRLGTLAIEFSKEERFAMIEFAKWVLRLLDKRETDVQIQSREDKVKP